jgi:hypothetical protein
MDLAAICAAAAAFLAGGALEGVAGEAARSLMEAVRRRFKDDRRSQEALESAQREPGDAGLIAELAGELRRHAERDAGFGAELADWYARRRSEPPVVQQVRAGRDAFTAGRDQRIDIRPHSGDEPGE